MRRGLAAFTIALAALATAGPSSAAAGADPGWAQRALGLQYELESDLPLRNTPWVYTHNSYNSVAEMGPTLSDQDPNQSIAIVDQLDIGVRHLEIDIHLFPSPRDPRVGALGPVVCHAQEPGAGCSAEKPLVEVLREVRGWLDRHPRQVLLLYLESHLQNEEGYAAGADSVEEAIGGLVYRPPSAGARCDPMPLELSRDEVRAAGKQVVAIGPCGEGARWPSLVFDEDARQTGSDNAPFEAFPSCGPDFTRTEYDAAPIRYYEDATQLTANVGGGADPIGPELTASMTRCGVDLIGFDFLIPGDARLESLVWSWAPGQPDSAGDCSVQRPDGRWGRAPAVSATEWPAASVPASGWCRHAMFGRGRPRGSAAARRSSTPCRAPATRARSCGRRCCGPARAACGSASAGAGTRGSPPRSPAAARRCGALGGAWRCAAGWLASGSGSGSIARGSALGEG